ncbi:MAG: hypothetical protein HQK54_02625 [Oligoflexales bacterium]|nr:hypothetical protein [Oligoflexales bacterium]
MNHEKAFLELIKPSEFFRNQIASITETNNIKIEDYVEFYLVTLLCDFIEPTKITQLEDINILETPLAIMLKKGLEADLNTQIKIFKCMGDTSLYFSGYFQKYFNRKTIDAEYYISMGITAFNKVADIMRRKYNENHFFLMYRNLANEFRILVDIISIFSKKIGQSNIDPNILDKPFFNNHD